MHLEGKRQNIFQRVDGLIRTSYNCQCPTRHHTPACYLETIVTCEALRPMKKMSRPPSHGEVVAAAVAAAVAMVVLASSPSLPLPPRTTSHLLGQRRSRPKWTRHPRRPLGHAILGAGRAGWAGVNFVMTNETNLVDILFGLFSSLDY